MRVTYNREMKVKEHLDSLGMETFIPMRYKIVGNGSTRKRMLVPAIHNLIFVKSTRENLTLLKQTVKQLEPLRFFITPPNSERNSEILRVPNRQMENFMRVASVQDDSVFFLQPGQRLLRRLPLLLFRQLRVQADGLTDPLPAGGRGHLDAHAPAVLSSFFNGAHKPSNLLKYKCMGYTLIFPVIL